MTHLPKLFLMLMVFGGTACLGFTPQTLAQASQPTTGDRGIPTTEQQPQQNGQVKMTVELRNGTVLHIDAVDTMVTWNSVAPDGTITQSEVRLSQLQKLTLAKQPASAQVAEVRRLVTQLASGTYEERHRAEKRLTLEGMPFVTIIDQAKFHEEPEVRYRIRRILQSLANAKKTKTVVLEFDRLILENLDALEGDVVDWKLICQWNGQSLSLGRKSIVSLTKRSPSHNLATQEIEQAAARVDSIIDDQRFFEDLVDEEPNYQLRPGYQLASFENDAQGQLNSLERNSRVEQFFTFLGCLFQCESREGSVIISGFRFRQSRSSAKSIGNFFVHPQTGKDVRYQGVMRVDFCVPGRPEFAATVHEIGMFLEIVLSKHTIIEAYNSSGHLIGVTQAARDRGSFVGFKSNIPIAYVRIRANEYLDVEKLNQDFAVDDVVFSVPQYAPEINRSPKYVVVSRDGQRILARSIELAEDQVYLRELGDGLDEATLPLETIRWVVGPQRESPPPRSGGYFVMTKAGSVLHCSSQLALSSQDSIQVPLNEIIGIWNDRSVARYPHADDFDYGKVVVARPLSRVALKTAELAAEGPSLKFRLQEASNLRQPMFDDQEKVLISEVTEKDLGVALGAQAMSLNGDSTIWMSAPRPRAAGLGVVITYDGQEFVIGGDADFTLDKLSQDTVFLSQDDKSISLPLDEVKVLQLPDEE